MKARMAVNLVLEALISTKSPSQARRILKESGNPPGFAEAYFQRIAALYGDHPERAIILSSHWKEVGEYTGQMHFAYRAKAAGERLLGKWSASASAFIEAGRHCEDKVEQLSFQAGAVDSLAKAGRVPEAIALGRRLARGLDKMGQPVLAARIKLNLGNVLVWHDEYSAAEKWLIEAVDALALGDHLLEAAAAKLGLSTAYLFGAKPTESARLAAEARDYFLQEEMGYYADLCSINLAHEAVLTGRADEGLMLLLELRQRLANSPVDAARVEEYLGDAYLKLNLLEEAIDSFTTARKLQTGKEMSLSRAHCAYGKAAALFGQGAYRESAKGYAQALSGYRQIGNRMWSEVASLGAIASKRKLGRLDNLAGEISHHVATLRGLRSRYHLANGLIEAGRVAIATGSDPGVHLASAERLIRTHGFVSMEWSVHAIRAAAAPKGGRLPHFRRSFQGILESRILTTSSTARLRFLRDKSEVIADYLQELLEKPNRRRVSEAVKVITECRSATLLDEILSSVSKSIDPAVAQELESLRRELANGEIQRDGTSSERRGRASLADMPHIRRKWLELTNDALTATATHAETVSPQTSIYSEVGPHIYQIRDGISRKLPYTSGQMGEALQWLEFQMLAPMLDPDIDPSSLIAELRQMGKALDPSDHVSPDGVLWKVPWQALASLADMPEPQLLPSPIFSASSAISVTSTANVCIWYQERPDLPHVAQEVDFLREVFPNANICNTAGQVRQSMERGEYDLLHVAGHARFHPENPMFSYLEFADGNVYANEIAKSGIRCNTAVLSACETGSFSFTFKEEPEGLTRAFLARSAKAVLASSWPVDDESASRFMQSFYSRWISGATMPQAVSFARNACRQWRNHPYFWAPFVLFAGYRD
jgi:tetratricopeptide (TPR) repeat protein